MTDNKNATSKSGTDKPDTNAEGQNDLASKPVVDAKAMYGEPPTADEAKSAPEGENKAATEKEEA